MLSSSRRSARWGLRLRVVTNRHDGARPTTDVAPTPRDHTDPSPHLHRHVDPVHQHRGPILLHVSIDHSPLRIATEHQRLVPRAIVAWLAVTGAPASQAGASRASQPDGPRRGFGAWSAPIAIARGSLLAKASQDLGGGGESCRGCTYLARISVCAGGINCSGGVPDSISQALER